MSAAVYTLLIYPYTWRLNKINLWPSSASTHMLLTTLRYELTHLCARIYLEYCSKSYRVCAVSARTGMQDKRRKQDDDDDDGGQQKTLTPFPFSFYLSRAVNNADYLMFSCCCCCCCSSNHQLFIIHNNCGRKRLHQKMSVRQAERRKTNFLL